MIIVEVGYARVDEERAGVKSRGEVGIFISDAIGAVKQ